MDVVNRLGTRHLLDGFEEGEGDIRGPCWSGLRKWQSQKGAPSQAGVLGLVCLGSTEAECAQVQVLGASPGRTCQSCQGGEDGMGPRTRRWAVPTTGRRADGAGDGGRRRAARPTFRTPAGACRLPVCNRFFCFLLVMGGVWAGGKGLVEGWWQRAGRGLAYGLD